MEPEVPAVVPPVEVRLCLGRCGKNLNTLEIYQFAHLEGDEMCGECYERLAILCHECGTARYSSNTAQCVACEYYYCDEHEHECDGDTDVGGITYRKYGTTKEFQSDKPGAILHYTRKFGIELECVAGSSKDAITASHLLHKDVGVGTDGSVRGTYGMEFQTPIASGDKGEDLVKVTTDILVDNRFTVNASCGLHVHLDMADFLPIAEKKNDGLERFKKATEIMNSYTRGAWNMQIEPPQLYQKYRTAWDRGSFTPDEEAYIKADPFWDYYVNRGTRSVLENDAILSTLKAAMMFYVAFDDTILSFLPISRRSNDYCRPFRSYFSLKEIAQAKSHSDLEVMWYRMTERDVISAKRESKHGSRRKGINMHTFFSAGHIEIRYHSGTLNASKILHWINLHMAILERAKNVDKDYFYEVASEIRLDKKAEILFDLLNLTPQSREYFRARQEKFATHKEEVAILAKKKEPKTCVV